MTYRIGTIGEFMTWTKQVIQDPEKAGRTPKRWFDSEATAQRVLADEISAEAMVKLLSPENIRLLRTIDQRKPASMRRLAELTGRKESNLSRTLKKLEHAGLIAFRSGPGRTRSPMLVARKVRLEIDLVQRPRKDPIKARA